MKKLRSKILVTITKKSLWQVILATLFIALAIFFVKNQHLELIAIQEKLETAKPLYLLLGAVFTIIYFLLQGMMYQYSFRAINLKVDLKNAVVLFLKRNLVSVFLPAGGFSSLVFFTKNIEKKNISKTQIHFASYIYALCGLISVVVVAIPTLAYMLLKNSLSSDEMYAFVGLVALILVLGYLIYSLTTEGFVYHLIIKYMPDLTMILDEIKAQKLNVKHFVMTNIVSVFIEFVGIAHLYIAILAFGFHPSLEASVIGYVVMVLLLIMSPFLRGMGAIEVSMTYVLIRYGFSTVAAASITLLFRFFEFWLPLFTGAFTFILKKDNFLLRILPSVIILVLGITNIISAITPSIPARLHLLESILPLDVINISDFLVLVFGFILIILSMFLLRGVKSAWWMAVVITFLSFVGHIMKAFDYEEATLAIVSFSVLIYTRKQYALKPDPRFTKLSINTFLISFGAVFLYGIIGFYFLDKRHFMIDFNFKESVTAILKIFFLFDSSKLVPHTAFARRFLFSLYFFGFSAITFVIITFLRPFVLRPDSEDFEREEAQKLVQKYGRSSLDYFKTYADKNYFFSEDKEGFLAYKVGNGFAVVLDDPVCSDEIAMRSLVMEFDRYCDENGLMSVFYRVPESSLPVYTSLKKKSLLIGQEAILDLENFTLAGGKMKSIRNALKKVESTGLSLKIYEAPVKEGVIQKLQSVSDEWLVANKRNELVFSQGMFDKELLKDNTILAVEDKEEKVYAFVNIIPDHYPQGGTYDLIRKSDDAPNGVFDYLMVNMFEYFKQKGIRYVNLGLAPLAGIEKGENITERTMKFAYENIRSFSHYKGLREYKDKFFPQWVNKYLVYDNSYELLQLPAAISKVSKK